MAYIQTEVPTNPCDETNDDDEFGEFTSAVSLTPSSTDHLKTQCSFPSKNGFPPTQTQFASFQPHLSQSTTNSGVQPVSNLTLGSEVFVNPIPGSDEEFGDFCQESSGAFDNQSQQVPETATQSESHTNVITPEEAAKFQPNYNIDLDTDTALTQLSWNSVHSSEETNHFATETETNNSDLLCYTPAEGSEGIDHKDLCIQSDAPPSLFIEANPEEASTDDEFGEFTHAPSQIVADRLEPEQDISLPIQVLEQTEMEEGPSVTVDEYSNHTEPTYSAPVSDISFETPHFNWDESFTSNSDPVPETVNVAEDNDVEDQQVFEEVTQEVLQFLPEVLPEVLPEIVPEVNSDVKQVVELVADDVDDIDDDFGDFAHFQAAPVVDEDVPDDDFDEFDDFEVAAPVESEENDNQVAAGASQVGLSPEHKIQQLLSSIFPFEAPSSSGSNETESYATESKVDPSWKVPPPQLIDNSEERVVWSCIKEVELTPALSFQWRRSAAHQRFLSSLRIDSQSSNSMGAARWHSWSSSIPAPVNPSVSSSSSMSSSNSSSVPPPMNGAIVPVTLDLDFFLGGSRSTKTSATTSSNLLESIEKEILSAAPATPTKDKMVAMSSSTSAHQLGDIFDHLQLQDCSSAASVSHCQGNAIDLLQ